MRCLCPWPFLVKHGTSFLKLDTCFVFLFHAIAHPLGMFLPLHLLLRYWIQYATVGCLYIKFVFSTRSFYRGVPGFPWWRHQIETFSALLAICAGNSPVPGEFPAQRPVTRGFDVFFDLRLNKRLSKQSWGWWFETLSCSLWRHCNVSNCLSSGYLAPWIKHLPLVC